MIQVEIYGILVNLINEMKSQEISNSDFIPAILAYCKQLESLSVRIEEKRSYQL